MQRTARENLRIHTAEEVRLLADWLFDKVVRRGRGGFCDERIGLFAELLVDLGERFPTRRRASHPSHVSHGRDDLASVNRAR